VGVIWTSKTRTRQPQAAVSVQDRRWEYVWNGASPTVDLATGKAWTKNANGTTVPADGMVGVAIDGNTTNGGYTSPGKTGVKTQFSFVSVFKQATTGTNNYPQLMSLGDSFNSVALATNSSAGGQLGILFPGIKALSEVSFTAGVVYVVVASHDTATGEFYTKIRPLNGGAITAARGNNTVAAASLSGTNRVGICRTDFGGSWNGNIYLAAAGLFFLTEGQSELYLHNPWQLFAPTHTRHAVGAVAAASAIRGDAAES